MLSADACTFTVKGHRKFVLSSIMMMMLKPIKILGRYYESVSGHPLALAVVWLLDGRVLFINLAQRGSVFGGPAAYIYEKIIKLGDPTLNTYSTDQPPQPPRRPRLATRRSEERRVGKECLL